MASLRQRGNVWEARIRWRVDGIQQEKRIPLDTTKENVADIRMVDINKYEPAIKRGKAISFPWDNDDGEIQIVHYN